MDTKRSAAASIYRDSLHAITSGILQLKFELALPKANLWQTHPMDLQQEGTKTLEDMRTCIGTPAVSGH